MKEQDHKGYGDWALATWNWHGHVELHFVLRKNGKPALHYHPTFYAYEAYRWNSYHAAAKFKRENKCLGGYVIVNLKEIKELSEMQAKIDDAQTAEERAELRRRFGEDY